MHVYLQIRRIISIHKKINTPADLSQQTSLSVLLVPYLPKTASNNLNYTFQSLIFCSFIYLTLNRNYAITFEEEKSERNSQCMMLQQINSCDKMIELKT